MRTSHTHPLAIAEVEPEPDYGKIGLTFCPGKIQPNAVSGAWSRDLGVDLDAIAAWNASVIVTLVEGHELESLKVPHIGQEAHARQIAWLHLPIRDVSVPDAAFEAAWREAGAGLRARIRQGANVLIHCKGGLGRAGMISARLLVELGWDPGEAIAAVRHVRPGAIETREQEAHVRSRRAIPNDADATEDRAVGALLGLAVGDAIGTTLEFKARDTYHFVTDMVGGGPFRLRPGEWTDDTSMALALTDSLTMHPDLQEQHLMERFWAWYDEGTYSATGRCFDIGITTREALTRWRSSGDPVAGSTAPDTAGNGSLMRLSPVAIRHWRDRARMRDVAARQSRTTHGAQEAVDACVVFSELLADAICGRPASALLRPRRVGATPTIAEINAGSWREKTRREIRATGYVVHSLEAALWCVGRTTSFREAVLLAANLGEDADTTAAITGQLAGAIYGASGIPAEWLEKLAWRPRIQGMATALFRAGLEG